MPGGWSHSFVAVAPDRSGVHPRRDWRWSRSSPFIAVGAALSASILNRTPKNVDSVMAQKRTHDSQSDSGRDPLGEPLGHFGTGLRAMLYIGVAMIFGLCGGGIVGASGPLASVVLENPDGTIYTILGWVFVAIGMLLIAYGVFQSGRSFEVRRKGVRYRTRNSLTEMFWDEI